MPTRHHPDSNSTLRPQAQRGAEQLGAKSRQLSALRDELAAVPRTKAAESAGGFGLDEIGGEPASLTVALRGGWSIDEVMPPPL